MREQLGFLISPDGLALDVQIGLPASELQSKLALGQPLPAATKARALIDTGADATSISTAVVARLGLVSPGRVQMNTAGGSAMVNRYEISLSIFGSAGCAGPALVRPSWPVTEFVQALHGIDCLVGMDLIREILLTIDGPHGQFTLTFDDQP